MVEQKNTNANPNQKSGDLIYQRGFYNEHSTEALAEALPEGGFSPQKIAYGLYAEKFSATSFTAPRNRNFRNWFYRIRPSVVKGDFYPIDKKHVRSAPILDTRLRNQLGGTTSDEPIDFIDGIHTMQQVNVCAKKFIFICISQICPWSIGSMHVTIASCSLPQ